MLLPLRLLPLAWLAVAATGPIKWVLGVALHRTWVWEAWFLWVFASQLATALCPFLAGALLWRRRHLAAAAVLAAVAGNDLLEHVYLFEAPLNTYWLRAFLPHISLDLVTLGVVAAFALGRALESSPAETT